MTDGRWMIYGYGYTGTLVAEEAVKRGHRPVLAGRSPEKLASLANRLGLERVLVSLDDAGSLRRAMEKVDVVYLAAGPFSHTSEPVVNACLAAGASYLDITGEIPVFERTFSRDAEARRAGVALISGAGFDVVPSDCLAAYVAAQVPKADLLDIVVGVTPEPSGGTARSLLEILPGGGLVRRHGNLMPWPMGLGARRIRLGDGEHTALPMPLGDVVTAYRSTGVPNITAYLTTPPAAVPLIRYGGPLAVRLVSVDAVKRALQSVAGTLYRGPNERNRQARRAYLWARAEGGGGAAEAWMETYEAYRFTALAAVHAVERLLRDRPTGALTPAQAFGPDFPLEIEGTRRSDDPPA